MTYTNYNGYLIPNLELPAQPQGKLNRWGWARLRHLREHKPLRHKHLLTQGQLWSHLLETQATATQRVELLTAQMAQGLTEGLKARDQMAWLGAMNNMRNQAEEMVRREIVFH